MWTTTSKISVFVVITVIFGLLLALNISRSNTKVLAISILADTGRIETGEDTLYYYPNDKEAPIGKGTESALKYLGRGYKVIKIE